MAFAKNFLGWLEIVLLCIVVGPLLPSLTRADIIAPGDVEPSDPTTWTTTTTALIGNTTSGTVTVNQASTISNGTAINSNNAYLSYGDNVTGSMVMIDGTGSAWANAGTLTIANGNNTGATLTITNGGTVSSSWSCLGYSPGSSGVATIDGAGSTWDSTGYLYVGNSGSGTLTITNGGAVFGYGGYPGNYVGYSPGSSGMVTIDGTGSMWNNLNNNLTIANGDNSRATLTISNGGRVNDGYACIGYGTSSTGVATVNGAGSTWYGPLTIANGNGSGTLTISNGGTVRSNNSVSYIGYGPASTGVAMVDGDGSAWANSGSLYVGNSGSGTLSITNGGTVGSSWGGVGIYSGSSGIVTVDGAGSTWNSSQYGFIVGGSGSGTLSVTNGGTVISSGTVNSSVLAILIAESPGSTGAASIDGSGSQWLASKTPLLIAGNPGFGFGSGGVGTLSITNGGAVSTYSGAIGGTGSGWGGSGTVTVDGKGSTWTNAYNLMVGGLGSGTLIITNGAVVTDTGPLGLGEGADGGVIGYSGNSIGAVTVAGAGSKWRNGCLFVGYYGTGTLNVAKGATVISTFASIAPWDSSHLTSGGTVTVDGPGSTWANTGDLWLANGTLRITNGGAVTDTGGGGLNGSGITIGSSSSTNGILAVDGAGSSFTNTTSLCIGGTVSYVGGCQGAMNITNGGAVSSSGSATIGQGFCGGTVTVDGSGSTWNASGGITVGAGGTGTLKISNGGIVTTNVLAYVARQYGNASSLGTVTVDGAGSTWNANAGVDVGYGYGGSGTLAITNGGTVVANTVVAGSLQSYGTVTFDGGTFKAYNAGNSAWITTGSGSGNIYVNGGGAQFDTSGYAMGIGMPLQHGGSNPIDGGITKLGAGTLTLTGANTYTGLTTVQAGTLELGSAAQSPVLTGAGASVQGGSLVFDYSGASPASTIQSLLSTGYNGGNNPWTTGQFTTNTQGGTIWLGSYDDAAGHVIVAATLQGDVNCDGTVDGTDLGLLINNMGTGTTWSQGDFNYSGTTDGTDLGLVINNMGQLAPVSSSLAIARTGLRTVPEPSTLVLLASGLIGLLAYAWRKR